MIYTGLKDKTFNAANPLAPDGQKHQLHAFAGQFDILFLNCEHVTVWGDYPSLCIGFQNSIHCNVCYSKTRDLAFGGGADNKVWGNRITHAIEGIRAGGWNTVEREARFQAFQNVVEDSLYDGIIINSAGAKVSRNEVRRAGQSGIVVCPGSLDTPPIPDDVHDNLVEDCAWHGIQFDCVWWAQPWVKGTTVERNHCRRNLTGIYGYGIDDLTIYRNQCINNKILSVMLHNPDGQPAPKVKFDANVCDGVVDIQKE